MLLIKQKTDNLGAIASMLCLLHCVATPFLFIAQAGSISCCSSSAPPIWWRFIDYFFLIISFFAIHYSTKSTSSNWMKPALWISWILLFTIIVNEKFEWFYLNENFIYFPAIILTVLHLYNKKYCQCSINKCCTNEK